MKHLRRDFLKRLGFGAIAAPAVANAAEVQAPREPRIIWGKKAAAEQGVVMEIVYKITEGDETVEPSMKYWRFEGLAEYRLTGKSYFYAGVNCWRHTYELFEVQKVVNGELVRIRPCESP